MSRRRSYQSSEEYRIRVQSCLVASLVALIAVVRLWPLPSASPGDDVVYAIHDQDRIEMEEVQTTEQALRVPPPPAPPIPIFLPDEAVPDPVDLDLSDAFFTEDFSGLDALLADGLPEAESDARVGPTLGPRTLRFVEPEYTNEARRSRIRAELVVEVLVDENGRVRETRIVERFLFDQDAKRPVDVLGYGLEEAALSAAERWIFRPAMRDGEPVTSYTTLTFSFGV